MVGLFGGNSTVIGLHDDWWSLGCNVAVIPGMRVFDVMLIVISMMVGNSE